MKDYKIDTKRNYFGEDVIAHFEKTKNAKFVCVTCIQDKNGNWINKPFALFYSENKHPVSNSNYFVAFYDFLPHDYDDPRLFVTNGQSAVLTHIDAIEVNGTLYYSAYRHDAVEVDSVMIDGGRDYTRTNSSVIFRLNIVDGELIHKQ